MSEDMPREEITQKVLRFLSDELEIDPNEININNLENTFEAIGLDSIYFIKIIIELEELFDICFDDDKLILEEYKNVGELIDYIFCKCNANKA